MSHYFRFLFRTIAVLAVSALSSVAVTVLLFPFWSWFEAFTGIESLGHSGPANWCYVLMFVIIATGLTFGLVVQKKPVRRAEQNRS